VFKPFPFQLGFSGITSSATFDALDRVSISFDLSRCASADFRSSNATIRLSVGLAIRSRFQLPASLQTPCRSSASFVEEILRNFIRLISSEKQDHVNPKISWNRCTARKKPRHYVAVIRPLEKGIVKSPEMTNVYDDYDQTRMTKQADDAFLSLAFIILRQSLLGFRRLPASHFETVF